MFGDVRQGNIEHRYIHNREEQYETEQLHQLPFITCA
jgi:hypothetical protein